jgi:hypothetical protein
MKALTLALLTAVLIAAVPGQQLSKREIPADFKSDNCTAFPDGSYADCCVEHDKDYYFGGSLQERRASDKRLKECVASKGRGWKRKLLANAMYIGVRIGGVHFLPTPFRWGFGNKWPRKEPEKPKAQPNLPTGQ